jgi:hypothetical protein
MNKSRLMAIPLAALALAACGSSHTTTEQKQEMQQEATKFETQAERCLSVKGGKLDLTPLRTKLGRHAFSTCLLPTGQRTQFESCATKATFGHFDRVVIESGLNSCLEKMS